MDRSGWQFYAALLPVIMSCVCGGRKTYFWTKIDELKEKKGDLERKMRTKDGARKLSIIGGKLVTVRKVDGEVRLSATNMPIKSPKTNAARAAVVPMGGGAGGA
jgi:hypothetical protein